MLVVGNHVVGQFRVIQFEGFIVIVVQQLVNVLIYIFGIMLQHNTVNKKYIKPNLQYTYIYINILVRRDPIRLLVNIRFNVIQLLVFHVH